MFLNDVTKKEEIRNISIQHLKKYGIKFRPKKPRPAVQVTKYGRKLFKVPLQTLETETVTLKDGQQLIIPKRLHEICSFILKKATMEGIFRKEGSKSRQNEIKLSLDRGCMLGEEHHVIDVAAVLKSFLRELPESLIPHGYHELFLRCSLVEKKSEAIHLACLLLPTEHLNVLSYLMQFFHEVSTYSECNKMTSTNLAIVVGPSIFPVDEKVAPKSQMIVAKICDIVKIMIDRSKTIGLIPEYIIEQVGNMGEEESDKRKKKRRSGSLTRMFNGLKKMVVNKSEEDISTAIVTPDLLLTPCISRSMKKRKFDTGLSSKKRKDVLNKLPECALLNTPFTPTRTPVSINPNGKKLNSDVVVNSPEQPKDKRLHWYMRSKSTKSLKDDESKPSNTAKGILERRWSAVSQAANFRKKKRQSCSAIGQSKLEDELVASKEIVTETRNYEPDYVRVPKTEYEEIKNRVSAIEKCISMEFDNVHSHVEEERNLHDESDKNIINVQNAYQHTLEQAGALSPTTDHLARRLSKELKIRKNPEQKIIRSPSARKIGSLRRRSRETEKKITKLARHQSWHVGYTPKYIENNAVPTIPRVNLKRNTSTPAHAGYIDRKPLKEIPVESINIRQSHKILFKSSSPLLKTHETSNYSNSVLSCNTSGSSNSQWMSAEGFFSTVGTPKDDFNNGRESVAKLRSQNAGMVLAKAKLFDNVKDFDGLKSSSTQNLSRKVTTSKVNHKIGSVRSSETRMSCRVRSLRSEERKVKKCMSPRRRNGEMSHRQKIHNAKQYVVLKKKKENAVENSLSTPNTKHQVSSPMCTPKSMPHVKKPLTIKSPKRLCRTPGTDRKTPLKVLSTPIVNL